MTEGQLQRMAQGVAQWVYDYLIGCTQIDRLTALSAAVEAGNKTAQSVRLSIEECGISMKEEEMEGLR